MVDRQTWGQESLVSTMAVVVEADQESPDDEIERFAAAHLNNRPWKRLMRGSARSHCQSSCTRTGDTSAARVC